MLALDRCRWASALGLIALLMLAPAVTALDTTGNPESQQVADAAQGAETTALTAVQDGLYTADTQLVAAEQSAGLDGSGSSNPEGSGSPHHGIRVPSVPQQAPIAVPLDTLLQQAKDQLPMDQVANLKLLAERAAKEAADSLPIPEDAEPSAAPAEESPAATPSSTAAFPLSSTTAGTIAVAGAAAAAAATVAFFWFAGSSGTLGASASSGALGAKGAAGTDLRRLLPFASPLFTRFEKDTVLGHPRREALYALILQEPGISLQALGDQTGLSRTAVVHHLRLLEQQHLVVSRRVGRSRHYFENGGRYGHDQKEAYAILQNDRSKAVAEFIKAHPGSMQKSLCEALGIPPSIAHWHVQRLTQAALVTTVRQGRSVAYFPAPNLTAVAAAPAPLVVPAAV